MTNKFIDFRNEIRDMKIMMHDLLVEVRPKFYNPYDYIRVEDSFETLLCYKGVYFKSTTLAALGRTMARVGVEIDSRTLKRLMEDQNRWNELWALGIETVVGKQAKSGRWVCSDGNFLKSNLSVYINNPKSSSIYMKDANSDEEYIYNRANWVYSIFIDPEFDINDGVIFFTDKTYTNCAVYNLRELDSDKKGER